jgi:hypothetical protein
VQVDAGKPSGELDLHRSGGDEWIISARAQAVTQVEAELR